MENMFSGKHVNYQMREKHKDLSVGQFLVSIILHTIYMVCTEMSRRLLIQLIALTILFKHSLRILKINNNYILLIISTRSIYNI